MSLHTYIQRLKLADALIRRKATGDTSSFASKLSLSKSGTEKFIREMKEEGFPIYYSKNEKTYRYARGGKMVKDLFLEELDRAEMWRITGGKNNFDSFLNRNFRSFL